MFLGLPLFCSHVPSHHDCLQRDLPDYDGTGRLWYCNCSDCSVRFLFVGVIERFTFGVFVKLEGVADDENRLTV